MYSMYDITCYTNADSEALFFPYSSTLTDINDMDRGGLLAASYCSYQINQQQTNNIFPCNSQLIGEKYNTHYHLDI